MELLEASQQIAQWGRCVQWQKGMQLLEAWNLMACSSGAGGPTYGPMP